MTTIRPSIQPATPQASQVRDDAKMAAARAFFAAAMDKSQGAAATGTAAATSAAAPSATSSAPTAAAPQRIPRPGSLIDIRV